MTLYIFLQKFPGHCQHLTINKSIQNLALKGIFVNAQGKTVGYVGNADMQATFLWCKWETNCRIAGWNGSGPRLSLINSARWAPLITAACHRHAPLPQRADDHAPDLRAATGRPRQNTRSWTHPCDPIRAHTHTQRALFMHEFTDCQKDHNQNAARVSSCLSLR